VTTLETWAEAGIWD